MPHKKNPVINESTEIKDPIKDTFELSRINHSVLMHLAEGNKTTKDKVLNKILDERFIGYHISIDLFSAPGKSYIESLRKRNNAK